MIFQTIADTSTGATKSIGLLGKSLEDIKFVLSGINTNDIYSTLFGKSTINTSAIARYNAEIEKGIEGQTASEKTSIACNKATINLMQSANGSKVSTEALTAAQQQSTLAAQAAQVALKGLAIAGNMIVFATL